MPHAFRALALALASALAVGTLACSPGGRPDISIRVVPPSQSVLSTGDQLRLHAEVQGTTDARVLWAGEGINAAGIFASPTPGTFTVVVRPLVDPSRSATTSLRVVAPPTLERFAAEPALITAGEGTTLHWTVTGSSRVLLDGRRQTGTSASVAPAATQTFALEATNEAGRAVEASVTVSVVPPPRIDTFAADAPTLTLGQQTVLRWSTRDATEVLLDGELITSTQVVLTPDSTRDHLLEARNALGFAVSASVRIQVVAPPRILAFSADAAPLTEGQSTGVSWSTQDATEVRLDGVLVTGTNATLAPTSSADHVLEARNAAGFAAVAFLHIAVLPAPVIQTFAADVATLTEGQSTTLRWSTSAATALRINGVAVSGTSLAVTPSVTTDCVLEAQNAAGFAVTQTVRLTVVPAPVIASFTAARTALTQSESTLLSWSVTNATTVLVNGAVVSGSSLSISPNATTLVTLEARNSIGGAVTATLFLNVVPQVTLGFTASLTSFLVGTSSTLSWTAAGAATLTLDGAPVSGASLVVSPIRTTSYLLRATNSLGFETSQSLTLTVAPYPGTIWAAAGQVWLRWTDTGPISGIQTYDIYRSTSPINSLATATLVGRLLPEDVHAARLKLADSNATWVLPTAAGGTTALGATQAHFTWTPRAAETSFFAVVPSGSSAPQVRFGPIDETISAVAAHLQLSGVDASCGLAYSDYAIWLDGRAGAGAGRADFPVMGPASLNGLAAIFRIYTSPTAGGPMPGLMMLHGSGGSWLDHRPAASNDGPDIRLSKGIVAALDDAFAYTSGTTVSTGHTRWFGAWDGFDRFNGNPTVPPNGSMVHPYTLRRILWIRDWMIANRAVDPDRVLIAGHSMGALGAVTATRAFPDKFAGTLAFQGHTRVVSGFGDFLRGTEAQNLPTSLGASMVEVHDPAVLLAPGDLPPMHLLWGTTDSLIPWADKPATIAQLSALERGHQIWWDTRTHGYPWAGRYVGSIGLRAESLARLRRNQSYPAFSAEVSPDANTANPSGTQGGYLEWDPDSIVDTASLWSAELWLRGSASLAADIPTFATVTVDISIRRPQVFLPGAGAVRSWALRRSSDNALLQSGTLTVSSAGLVTARAVVVPKDPQRVRLSVGP